MSSAPTALVSLPSKLENLVGAILWLPAVEQIPDHGRYKLKAKACDHPCLVVQDCRATDDDTVRICILASYSQETSYDSLGKSEKIDHVPIHPNKPNDRTMPSILYLRPRQNAEMLLKRDSWVNTKRIYKVPISILRPYENFRSWCRYRLADTSIRALHAVLFPGTLYTTLTTSRRASLSSSIFLDNSFLSEDQALSPNDLLTLCEDKPSQQATITESENTLPNGSNSKPDEAQLQPLDVSRGDSEEALSTNSNVQAIKPQRIPLSKKPSSFHLIYPFDSGPHASTIANNKNYLPAPAALLLERVLNTTAQQIQTSRPLAQGSHYIRALLVEILLMLTLMSVLARAITLVLILPLTTASCKSA